MNYSKILKRGSKGEEVKYIQKLLIACGYSCGNSGADGDFGANTEKAVKNFQKNNVDYNSKKLSVDGIVGEKTWKSIQKLYKNVTESRYINVLKKYTHIEKRKIDDICAEIKNVNKLRQAMVVEAIGMAYDSDSKENAPRALYIFGQNLYNKNKKINYATQKMVINGANNPNTAKYYTAGRKEWMLEQIKLNPKLPASDCSGLIVGLMRKHELVGGDFDDSANNLCSSKHSVSISKENLMPGDWVGKNGHIGIYVGSGYVVEFYGGEYTCQLTKLNNRSGYSFTDKKIKAGAPWTKFRRPKYY